MTQIDTEPVHDDTSLDSIKHAVCPVCNPDVKPGDKVTAICGTERTVLPGVVPGRIPPDACVVCIELAVEHKLNHFFKGEKP